MNFIFEWQKNIYERAQRVSKILLNFITSSHCVMFFLFYRRKYIDKIIEGNY